MPKKEGGKITYWVIKWYVVSIVSTIPDLSSKLSSGWFVEVENGDGREVESLQLPQESGYFYTQLYPFAQPASPKQLPNPLAKFCPENRSSMEMLQVLPKPSSLRTNMRLKRGLGERNFKE